MPARPLDLIVFNVHKGSGAAVLNAALHDAGNPDVAAVQEAHAVDGEQVHGYRFLRPDPERFPGNDQVRDCAVAVRHGVRVLFKVAWAVPGGRWRYEDNRNDPRVWLRVAVEKHGVQSEVWCVHRCPLGPNPPKRINRRAWKAEHKFLVKKVREVRKVHPERRIDIVGDWNTYPGKRPGDKHSIESLARAVGGVLHMNGIDGALTIGGGEYDVREQSDAHGSDHRPVVLRPRS